MTIVTSYVKFVSFIPMICMHHNTEYYYIYHLLLLALLSPNIFLMNSELGSVKINVIAELSLCFCAFLIYKRRSTYKSQ